MFIVAALASRIFVTIPSGHGGILWLRFFGGTQTRLVALGEGLHIICPWDEIDIYDLRVQEREQSYDVIVNEGLQISVKSSFRWHLNRPTLPKLHKEIGPNYVNVLLVPEVGSVLRERIAQYSVADLFSDKRSHVQTEILDGVTGEADGRGYEPHRQSSNIGGRPQLRYAHRCTAQGYHPAAALAGCHRAQTRAAAGLAGVHIPH